MSKHHRSYLHYLEDIHESMKKILYYTKGFSYSDFNENELVIDAVLRNFEILGEASNRIPDRVKKKYPQIPWQQMYALRNFVIHAYFGIDLETLWTIISENLSTDIINIESAIEVEKNN